MIYFSSLKILCMTRQVKSFKFESLEYQIYQKRRTIKLIFIFKFSANGPQYL